MSRRKSKLSQKKTKSFVAAGILASALSCGYLYFANFSATDTPSEFDAAVSDYETQQETLKNELRVTEHQVKSGSTLAQALRDAGLSNTEVHDLVVAARELKDLNRIPSKLTFKISWKDVPETLATQVELLYSHSESLKLTREDNNYWKAIWLDLPIQKRVESFAGVVSSNLWDSAVASGMDSQLVIELATVFAWQVDFNREVQPGDRWRIIVEKLFVNDQHIGWGNILAAEYENHGEPYTAVRFPQEGRGAYYAPDGSSLRRMFLKSPIKFGRITSTFKSARFHPVLKVNRPHNGVDYAAPIGTPIMSVGKGVVESAGRNGGSGIMIKIRHNSNYNTAYLHLSRIAKGIHRGVKVEQGDVIGYVGATGLATGPHLHFAFYENGRFVDPLGRKFPSADPVESNAMDEFSTVVTKVLSYLPAWSVASQDTDPHTDI